MKLDDGPYKCWARNRSSVLLHGLIVLLVSCGGGGVTPPTNDPPPIDIPEPKPLEVAVALDESQSVTQSIPAGGGTLSLTDESGATYTLTLPENALLEETDITLTPILNVEGSPITGGRLLGVELKPHGLRLYDHATLTIAPPGGGTGDAITFAAQGGKEFHLYPLELDASNISLKLIHFSEYGAYVASETDPIPVVDGPETFVPTDWEAQLEQMLAELTRKERRAQLKGEPGDPQFWQKVEAILTTFYDKVVKGMLAQIATDCAYAEANASKVLAWSRNVSLLGLDGKLAAKVRAVTEAVRKGADHCWKTAVGACIDRQNAVQVAEVARYARLNILLGGNPATYNPDDPKLRCPDACDAALAAPAWQGSVVLSYQHTGRHESEDGSTTVRVLRTAQVRFTLDEKLPDARPWAVGWKGTLTEGTAEIFDSQTVTSRWGSQTHEIKGSGTPLLGRKGAVTLYLSAGCVDYTFLAHVDINAKNDFLNGNVAPSRVAAVNFYGMPAQQPTPRPLELGGDGAFTIENVSEPKVILEGGGTYTSGLVGTLRRLVGAENMGKADVAWVISPVGKP